MYGPTPSVGDEGSSDVRVRNSDSEQSEDTVPESQAEVRIFVC